MNAGVDDGCPIGHERYLFDRVDVVPGISFTFSEREFGMFMLEHHFQTDENMIESSASGGAIGKSIRHEK